MSPNQQTYYVLLMFFLYLRYVNISINDKILSWKNTYQLVYFNYLTNPWSGFVCTSTDYTYGNAAIKLCTDLNQSPQTVLSDIHSNL